MLTFAGKRYEDTDEDRLWLLRAVQAEGPPQIGVARALVNGFCCSKALRHYPGSLVAWVRSYAQPINPRWYPKGDLLALSMAAKSEEERRQAMLRAYLRESKHSTLRDFTVGTLSAVGEALSTPYHSDVTDYAAAYVDASFKGYEARTPLIQGQNRFWTRRPGWPGYDAQDTRGYV